MAHEIRVFGRRVARLSGISDRIERFVQPGIEIVKIENEKPVAPKRKTREAKREEHKP